jgi:hypothetical protein
MVFLASLLLLLLPCTSLILTVEPYYLKSWEECVLERVEKDNKLSGSFEIVSGGLASAVFLTVSSPNGDVQFNSEKVKTTKFAVMAPQAGLYKVCLVNRDREEKSVAVRGVLACARLGLIGRLLLLPPGGTFPCPPEPPSPSLASPSFPPPLPPLPSSTSARATTCFRPLPSRST